VLHNQKIVKNKPINCTTCEISKTLPKLKNGPKGKNWTNLVTLNVFTKDIPDRGLHLCETSTVASEQGDQMSLGKKSKSPKL
jgi:hypothetical protein